jgi:Protein of unknown function (DUF2752)
MMLRATTALGLFAVLLLVTPPDEPNYRLCGFYWLTGLPCALCGLTRGVFALAKGHLEAGIRWNALSPLGFLMLFSLFWDHPVRGRFWTLGIAAFAGYGVCRVLAS